MMSLPQKNMYDNAIYQEFSYIDNDRKVENETKVIMNIIYMELFFPTFRVVML